MILVSVKWLPFLHFSLSFDPVVFVMTLHATSLRVSSQRIYLSPKYHVHDLAIPQIHLILYMENVQEFQTNFGRQSVLLQTFVCYISVCFQVETLHTRLYILLSVILPEIVYQFISQLVEDGFGKQYKHILRCRWHLHFVAYNIA